MRYPSGLGEVDIHAFLTRLTVPAKVAAATQNQALAALPFPFGHVLRREVGELGEVARAQGAAPAEWRWQWVFPQASRWVNRVTEEEGRHHVDASLVQRTVQELLGHSDVKATMIYPHVSSRGPAGERSRVDALLGEARSADPCIMPPWSQWNCEMRWARWSCGGGRRGGSWARGSAVRQTTGDDGG